MELKTIEHYEILRTLGQGGMSTVYKAHDTKLDRPVALKLVSSDVSALPGFENRFLGSASAISALSHPNIAQVFEAGQCNGQLFLTMEYIDGISLRQRLNSRQSEGRFLELREIVTLARQVAQALHHAHQKSIIHRDIKPDNVMLRLDNASGDYRAVLMDFGLAQQVMGSLPAPEGVELIGTLEYMAPEQFRGLPLDGRTDIYSLGVMLYELISGQQPFRSASPFDLMLMHTQGEPERLQTLRPDTPPSLISIVYRAMLKNPNERYQTAGEIGRELEALEKTISSLNQTLTWTARPNATSRSGPATIFDVLPTLDRPVLPVDLVSEGVDDMVIVTAPTGTSWSVPFEKPSLLVGRDPSCDLHLDEPRVSRRHVRIDRLPDARITVTDLGSVNGLFLSDIKLEKNMTAVWNDGQSVKVGPFWLTLRYARTPIGLGRRLMALSEPSTAEVHIGNQDATLRLTPAEVLVEPGQTTSTRVELINRRNTEQEYILEVEGIPADWYSITPFPLYVPAAKTSERAISFHPPRLPSSAARRYEYQLNVSPHSQTSESDHKSVSVTGALQIFPYYAFSAEVDARGSITYVGITNQGNSQRHYVTEVREPQNVLLVSPARSRTVIEPGASTHIEIKVQPKRRPIGGVPRCYPVEIFIRSDGMRPQQLSFEYWLRPLVAWWVLVILGIIAVSVLLFLLSGG